MRFPRIAEPLFWVADFCDASGAGSMGAGERARADGQRRVCGGEDALFQAFDEGVVSLAAEAAREVRLVVDETNLDTLLGMLNI